MEYKLLYFQFRGRAEMIRYLLHDNGLTFEDGFVQPENWPEVKLSTPFGRLPMLQDGDLKIFQSGAIMRHLARKHGLYGSNDKERTLVDVVYEGHTDLRERLLKLIYENYETGQDEYIRTLPEVLMNYERLLSSNNGGNGFFVGEKISYADYAMFDILDTNLEIDAGMLDKTPLLKGFHERIASRPAIAEYRKTERAMYCPVLVNY